MRNANNKKNPIKRGIKKFFYTGFVASTFVLYALQNHGTNATVNVLNTSGALSKPGTAVAALNTTTTSSTLASNGYKDGTYTGPVVNVRLWYVQVQATIQGGQLTNVQFLQYPNERNTSVRINSSANPQLIQEAIQAQSANVNIITGATLTSQGFQQSLQAALSQAKG